MLAPGEIERRLSVARSTIEAGGNLSRYAEALGFTVRGAREFLHRHAPQVCDELIWNRGQHEMARGAVLARLLLIKVHREFPAGQQRLAKALGMTSAALSMFAKYWAPDGLDAAIADLWPDDDAAPQPARRAA